MAWKVDKRGTASSGKCYCRNKIEGKDGKKKKKNQTKQGVGRKP